MKFLVDAQLPKRLASYLRTLGHDAVHTLDLPFGNSTPDLIVIQVAMAEQRIVITKDADFRDSLLLRGKPEKLLLVATGNINNNDLLQLFEQNWERIIAALAVNSYIELGATHLIIHL